MCAVHYFFAKYLFMAFTSARHLPFFEVVDVWRTPGAKNRLLPM
jgi:hypothetical protein